MKTYYHYLELNSKICNLLITQEYSTSLSCKYSGPSVNVFAVRVHAHYHGEAVAVYRVRGAQWNELMIEDPSGPQTFYPTKFEYEIKEGDILVGMCTYHNDEDRVVSVGHLYYQEMCNIFLMYYTANKTGVLDYCFDSFDTEYSGGGVGEASVQIH
jgi:hypothetical protein